MYENLVHANLYLKRILSLYLRPTQSTFHCTLGRPKIHYYVPWRGVHLFYARFNQLNDAPSCMKYENNFNLSLKIALLMTKWKIIVSLEQNANGSRYIVTRSTRVSSTYNAFLSTVVVVRVTTGLNPIGSSTFPQNISTHLASKTLVISKPFLIKKPHERRF